MAGNDCESQVFANVPEGFVKLLVSITKLTIGPSTRPECTLYQHNQRQRVYAPGRGAIQGRAFCVSPLPFCGKGHAYGEACHADGRP